MKFLCVLFILLLLCPPCFSGELLVSCQKAKANACKRHDDEEVASGIGNLLNGDNYAFYLKDQKRAKSLAEFYTKEVFIVFTSEVKKESVDGFIRIFTEVAVIIP